MARLPLVDHYLRLLGRRRTAVSSSGRRGAERTSILSKAVFRPYVFPLMSRTGAGFPSVCVLFKDAERRIAYGTGGFAADDGRSPFVDDQHW